MVRVLKIYFIIRAYCTIVDGVKDPQNFWFTKAAVLKFYNILSLNNKKLVIKYFSFSALMQRNK